MAPLGAAACLYTMYGLPAMAWKRFAVWLAIGIAIYVIGAVLRARRQNAEIPAAPGGPGARP